MPARSDSGDPDAPGAPKPGWKERIAARADVRQAVDLFRKETPKLTRNGSYDIGSESFRQACAVLEDGTVCVVRTYNTAEISVELARLRQEWRLPPETGRRSVTLAQMRACCGHASQVRVTHEETAGQLRLIKAIAEAAALGTSGIKLVQRSGHGELRIKVGARGFSHGPQWKSAEVREAVHWIHGHRDGGDGQPKLVEGKPAPVLDRPGRPAEAHAGQRGRVSRADRQPFARCPDRACPALSGRHSRTGVGQCCERALNTVSRAIDGLRRRKKRCRP